MSSKVKGLYMKAAECEVTTSCVAMEVEAVTHTLQQLLSQSDTKISHPIIHKDPTKWVHKGPSEMD